MIISVIIRTYNEERYLNELITAIKNQNQENFNIEILIIDSGSTDDTLRIAKNNDCIVKQIKKEDFTFGYSLNVGCELAGGDILTFVSGHCIPTNKDWLVNLTKPILQNKVVYCYGRQLARDTTKFSESTHFEKSFPDYDKLPQTGFFCNNANASIQKEIWESHRFDEKLTGLEDIDLSKRLTALGYKVGYVSTASVYHIHDETWQQVRHRYEREAFALQDIMPEIQFSLIDFIQYFFKGIKVDLIRALRQKCLLNEFMGIILFRHFMYFGTYKGSTQTRRLSDQKKRNYFYPKDVEKEFYEN